jgi:hypothetical protein
VFWKPDRVLPSTTEGDESSRYPFKLRVKGIELRVKVVGHRHPRKEDGTATVGAQNLIIQRFATKPKFSLINQPQMPDEFDKG